MCQNIGEYVLNKLLKVVAHFSVLSSVLLRTFYALNQVFHPFLKTRRVILVLRFDLKGFLGQSAYLTRK